MTPRSFASAVITGGSLLLGATMFANVVADPQGVFGTDVIAHSANPNWRYLQFRKYQQEASQIDGLIFASSRGTYLDRELLADRTGNRQILDFSVPYGLVTDHLPFLQYVLNDKKARGERLRSVLLLLDLDLFGTAPWTNTNIDAFLPPAVSGETTARFWWRYLTVFQYRNWRNSLQRRQRDASTQLSGLKQDDTLKHPVIAAFPAIAILRDNDARRSMTIAAAGQAGEDAIALVHRGRQSRPDLARQISYFRQFVELCRSNGIALTVATSPMVRANLDRYPAGSLEALTAELNRLTPIWDFASPPWLADDPRYWLDISHFSQAVGTMMIERMFLGRSSVPADFGRLRPQVAP